MTMTETVLSRVLACCERRSIAETTFGKLAVGDSTFVQRLRDGRVTIRIAEQALRWIEEQDAAALVSAGAPDGASRTDNLPPRAAE